MFTGFLIGIISAVLQSLSYIFSRKFVLKYNSPGKLTVFSQFWMMLLGAALLLLLLPWQKVEINCRLLLLTGGGIVCAQSAYFCFFRALQEIEASRLSALQGLKMIALAGLNMVLFSQYPSLWQWLAIVLASFGAVGMNFSGGRLSFKGMVFLAAALISFAGSDIVSALIIKAVPGNSPLLRAMAGTAFFFLCLGICSIPGMIKCGFDRKMLRDALPYGICWFFAIAILLASFDILGVMLGAIIQSSRGIFSVLLGALLLKCGFSALEPPVSGKTWLKRGIMAAVMVLAMFLYVR